MTPDNVFLVAFGIIVVAFLYSSVGHAGASGYIAVMTLASFSPEFIRPTALILNILVASLATWQFYRAGHFSFRLFWPFAILSVPMAFIGGSLVVPAPVFKILVGSILIYSAFRFIFTPKVEAATHPPSILLALTIGAGLGFLAGLTGTGGGIFLTPLLIFFKWSKTKTASATSALFILTNSIAGLAGNLSSTRHVPTFALPLAVAAICGGLIGSYLGSRKFSALAIKRLLACVLIVAGVKLILT
jgi:uncharacterized membrane protein YfcA